jgi:chitodextrinase
VTHCLADAVVRTAGSIYFSDTLSLASGKHNLSAQADAAGVPAVSYVWDFGEGTTASGKKSSHTYTRAADFDVHLTVEGLDGVSAQQTFSVRVSGTLQVMPKLRDNRRFVEPTSH